jgi:predicted glycoside hydrolase/deacetylase ChbG (UPF0249 family)
MILCADDFGMAEDINRAIATLARAGKIDAVSCMVNQPFFNSEELASLGAVKTGLHFTLAETPQEFRRLVCRAYARRINRLEIYNQLDQQYARFEKTAGRPPDFIDGHLHVQQLPVIRDVLIEFIKNRGLNSYPCVRNAAVPWAQCSLKSLLIAAPGRALKRKLLKAGIPTNDGFGGVYNYADFMRYPHHLKTFIETIPSTGIIMVHPGLNEPWRRAEYDALVSDVQKTSPFFQ